ncbi:ATP diphosphatase [Celeribacter halophilus]|uniref:Nucleoside triphosphate pyrophosphohydrolase n=2 Tax=Celeribacter halophilus TaxID=576117 RepID=A0A1I3TDC5_9RHOB|nr:ATP diphosphatase [Celeribacter halophilus]SFJ67731.1 ATP diphosphatase [Celeribacter halophilus]
MSADNAAAENEGATVGHGALVARLFALAKPCCAVQFDHMTQDPIHDVPAGIEQLLEIMRRLRDPEGGCPWDIEQDFATISPYTIEEAYEVDDAIARGDMEDLKSELGDLLFQSVFQAQIAADKGLFDFHDVAQTIAAKMISRHPHVFGDESNQKSPEQQTVDWEKEKAKERARRGETRVLDGVAMGLPALMRAQKLQKRAARVGFDWPDASHVLDKIREEAAELEEARDTLTQAEVFEEFGDLLFVVVNLGRHLGVDAEEALRACNAKFTRRFNAVEDALAARGKAPQDSDLAEMDALWDQAKEAEKRAKT